jgi:hypothetical protein
MKFKIIATAIVVAVMLVAFVAYLATKNSVPLDEFGNPIPQEEVQPSE